jgi:hypothetical protein
VAAFVAAAAIGSVLPIRAQTAEEEYRLKAAFVARFPQFVEWPAPALDGRQTLDLCIVGSTSPFVRTLGELVEGEALAGRRLATRLVEPADRVEGCHLLFLSATAPAREAVLKRVAGRPILTVSDAPRFLDEGGIILLRVADRRVRFDVSVSAAERAGLHLSSQLLRLALTVRGGPVS